MASIGCLQCKLWVLSSRISSRRFSYLGQQCWSGAFALALTDYLQSLYLSSFPGRCLYGKYSMSILRSVGFYHVACCAKRTDYY